MKRFAISLAVTFALASALPQAALAEARSLVIDGLEQCLAQHGESKPTKEALLKKGWESGGVYGSTWFFDAPRKDAIGGISSTLEKDKNCYFGVKGMSVAEAEKIASAFVKAAFRMKAKVVITSGSDHVPIEHMWEAPYSGHEVRVIVFRDFTVYPVYRGAIIFIFFD